MYASIVSRRTLLLICFFLSLAPIEPAEKVFKKMTPWNDLAFPHLGEEKSPEGKTGVPESLCLPIFQRMRHFNWYSRKYV
jgi:hypothetical protein